MESRRRFFTAFSPARLPDMRDTDFQISYLGVEMAVGFHYPIDAIFRPKKTPPLRGEGQNAENREQKTKT